MKWMFLPLRRYADFRGRSRRMEFWMFFVLNFAISMIFLVIFVASFIPAMMSACARAADGEFDDVYDTGATLNCNGVTYDVPSEVFDDIIGPAAGTIGIIYAIFWLIMLLPSLAVTVRRLHDSNRTGWWVLGVWGPYLALIPMSVMMFLSRAGAVGFAIFAILAYIAILVFGIILLVFMFMDGTRGPNRFGPDPKGPGHADTFA